MAIDRSKLLQGACDSVRSEIGKGKVADYMPALAEVDARCTPSPERHHPIQ